MKKSNFRQFAPGALMQRKRKGISCSKSLRSTKRSLKPWRRKRTARIYAKLRKRNVNNLKWNLKNAKRHCKNLKHPCRFHSYTKISEFSHSAVIFILFLIFLFFKISDLEKILRSTFSSVTTRNTYCLCPVLTVYPSWKLWLNPAADK